MKFILHTRAKSWPPRVKRGIPVAAAKDASVENQLYVAFILSSAFNILWNFVFLQSLLFLGLINLSLVFPRAFPPGHVFVLDSSEYLEEIYYYGSGPQEIDDHDLQQQVVDVDAHPA